MNDYILFILCETYIIVLVFAGFSLIKKVKIKPEVARKIVHILSSFWSLFLIRFDNPFIAVLSPFIFIFINSFFVLSHFSSRFGFYDRRRNLGFVLYPFSLTVMTTLLVENIIDSRVFLLATFILGFCDGFAGLIGSYWGRHTYKTFGGTKSIEGSSCFVVIAIMICLLFGVAIRHALVISIVSALVEAFSIKGFDNLFIPAGVIVLCNMVG